MCYSEVVDNLLDGVRAASWRCRQGKHAETAPRAPFYFGDQSTVSVSTSCPVRFIKDDADNALDGTDVSQDIVQHHLRG